MREQRPATLQPALRDAEQMVGFDRLEDEIERAARQARHRRPDVADAGQNEHNQVGIHGPRPREELEAVHDRHLHVGHREGWTLGLEDVERLAAVGGEPAAVTARPEELVEHPPNVPVIVDDQDLTSVCARGHFGTRLWPDISRNRSLVASSSRCVLWASCDTRSSSLDCRSIVESLRATELTTGPPGSDSIPSPLADSFAGVSITVVCPSEAAVREITNPPAPTMSTAMKTMRSWLAKTG